MLWLTIAVLALAVIVIALAMAQGDAVKRLDALVKRVEALESGVRLPDDLLSALRVQFETNRDELNRRVNVMLGTIKTQGDISRGSVTSSMMEQERRITDVQRLFGELDRRVERIEAAAVAAMMPPKPAVPVPLPPRVSPRTGPGSGQRPRVPGPPPRPKRAKS